MKKMSHIKNGLVWKRIEEKQQSLLLSNCTSVNIMDRNYVSTCMQRNWPYMQATQVAYSLATHFCLLLELLLLSQYKPSVNIAERADVDD